MESNNAMFSVVSYIVIVVLALAFLYFGNRIATRGFVSDGATNEAANGAASEATTGSQFFEARVREIVNIQENSGPQGNSQTITFEAEIISRGERRGETARFTQTIREYSVGRPQRAVEEGGRVVLASTAQGSWSFIDHVRIYNILILGGAFVVFLTLFGRMKGFNSVLSLGFTCAAIFAVFIPAILSNRNIYMAAIVVCMYSIIFAIFIINGVNKKSVAAVTGCLGGIAASGVLAFLMDLSLGLTGVTGSESVHLRYLAEYPIDLNAIIFAGIIIGATGAIIDMSISIASALWELKETNPSFGGLYKSGINIGKDIVGSNINTLVLAYIGGSLAIVLIFLSGDISFVRLLNREWVIVELLQIIVGSFGIFLTMPLTALVCAALFKKMDH